MELILAVDTATAWASVALWTPYAVLAEETWQSSANHTVELMPVIMRLMQQQHREMSQLTGLAVTAGPGSFTGLRIGLSLVKGLALALNIPVAAIPTLAVVAYAQSSHFLPLRSVLQAGRNRICWTDYRWQRKQWQPQSEIIVGKPEDLVKDVRERTLFCGELGQREVEVIQNTLGPMAVIASPAENTRRASYLAELAYRRFTRQESDDLNFAPTYLNPGMAASA